MSRVRFVAALTVFGFFSLFYALPAVAQGWGEQTSLQFRYSNQGFANEVARNQLGLSAAAAAAASGGGGSGLGTLQSNQQLNNSVQVTNNATYNVTVTGDGNYLNFDTNVNADQDSTDTNLSGSNTIQSTSGTNTSSDVLNQ